MLLLCAALIDDPDDELKFEDIYCTYGKQMLFEAQRILNDRYDAEDAVQNAFIGIARQIKNVRTDDPAALKAYALTAVKHSALNILRRKEPRSKITELSNDETAAVDDTMFDRVARSDDYELLLRALNTLPVKYREVLMLHYVMELKIAEVADVLGRKNSTVHQQLTRGKKLLIIACEKEGMSFHEDTVGI